MTEEAVNDQIPVDLTPKVGPGPALREARESRNFSLEAVAKQLRIDISLVHALEEDDYSKFAAPIYVTGHLRAYARLLGLPSDSFIDAYRNLGTANVPSIERVAHLDDQPEPSGNAQVPRWAIYLMVIVVVAAVMVIWRSEVTKLVMPFMGSQVMPEQAAQGESSTGGVVNPPNDTTSQQSLPLPNLVEKPANPPTSGAVDSTTDAIRTPMPQAVLPQARLSLKAEKPSWVEVKDGSGNRLFYDLMVPGDEKDLEGAPPFDVLLGYSPGIIVEYNGKRVDHSMYVRQDVARFRVSDQGTSRN